MNNVKGVLYLLNCVSFQEYHLPARPSTQWENPHFKPYFDPINNQQNITAQLGKSTFLVCKIRQITDESRMYLIHYLKMNIEDVFENEFSLLSAIEFSLLLVSWVKQRDLSIISAGEYIFSSDNRFRATHVDNTDKWALHIDYVQKDDEGVYECQDKEVVDFLEEKKRITKITLLPSSPGAKRSSGYHLSAGSSGKMEHEKQKWLIEKAELQAQQTILEGRIMSQFNLKKDLIRRIKMLEHCLRAERAKYHKLKYGIEPPQLHVEDEELKNECANENNSMPEITNTANWKKGRHLLRQYLLEIGYTDAIINIRSNRVRLLLGLNANEDELIENNQNINNLNAETQDNLNQQKEDKKYKKLVTQPNSTRLLATEAESTVASTIAFLKEQNNSQINSADQDDNEDEIDNANDIIDSETEEVLSEFDFLSTHLSKLSTNNNTNTIAPKSKNVDIGELADITPNDENPENVDSKSIESLILDEVGKMTKKTDKVSNNQQDWNPRFLLKSHFDVVRCVRFHYREALVVTGSEDETIKLWNLNKASCNTNKNLEPIYTYRGHKSAVLSLLIVENQIYSGGLNGEILVWQIPETFNSIEPYETYDASLFLGNLQGHTDAVWSLVALQSNDKLREEKTSEEVSENTIEECSKVNFICSASSDGTIKVWDIEKKECSKTIILNETWGKATCLAAFPFDAIVGADAKSNPGENISQYLAFNIESNNLLSNWQSIAMAAISQNNCACKDEEITSAFPTKFDLQAHQARVHTSGKQSKSMVVDFDIDFRENEFGAPQPLNNSRRSNIRPNHRPIEENLRNIQSIPSREDFPQLETIFNVPSNNFPSLSASSKKDYDASKKPAPFISKLQVATSSSEEFPALATPSTSGVPSFAQKKFASLKNKPSNFVKKNKGHNSSMQSAGSNIKYSDIASNYPPLQTTSINESWNNPLPNFVLSIKNFISQIIDVKKYRYYKLYKVKIS
ncbi:hypothetical protein RND71_044094 [Anisodus tanguticus]|uniref:Ig-like domain-containing protein n=1 Tax=Anisodus tanguticus TaxID=243964 RepID=A0AAE1QP80_9SOLA|nr:hypothetical protein RND71_044094 [Anisodus tanguticus]